MINPAVQGTLNALKSAASEPKVKRVVITASFACIMEPKEPGTYVFTEKDWNEYSLKQVRLDLRSDWTAAIPCGIVAELLLDSER